MELFGCAKLKALVLDLEPQGGREAEADKPIEVELYPPTFFMQLDESEISDHVSIKGDSAQIAAPTGLAPIEVIVPMTKHLHQSRLMLTGRHLSVFHRFSMVRLQAMMQPATCCSSCVRRELGKVISRSFKRQIDVIGFVAS